MELIGAIGFLATVFTLLTEQVAYMKRVLHNFADFEDDLKRYVEQIRSCQDLVEEWYDVWGNSFYQEPELYGDLWGEAGFSRIRVQLELLTKQIDKCIKLLRLECDLGEPDSIHDTGQSSVRRWLGLSEATKGRRRARRRDIGTIYRITYSLWNNENIYHQFENAVKMADALVSSTERFFRSSGYIADEDHVNEHYVSLCKNKIRMQRFASAIYQIFWRKRKDVEFLLTLRLPERDRRPQHLELVRRPRLDFAISFLVDHQGRRYRSERYYTIRQNRGSGTALGKDIRDWRVRDFIRLEQRSEISFEGVNYYVSVQDKAAPQYQCIRRKMDGRSKLCRQKNVTVTDYMVDASLSLSSVTLWFILFHKSGWFRHLQGSRLHRISSGESNTEEIGAVSIGGRSYMYRPWTLREASQQATQISMRELSQDQLLLLVAIIGELVLGHEVKVHDKGGVPSFIMRKNNRPVDVTATVFADLVEEVISLDMADAVDYCIKERHSHVVRMEEFQRKVVTP